MNFLGSEKNWLSMPLYVRKYHHLWNLLNRSCIYASTLLAVIEAKELKRKRKFARIKSMKARLVTEGHQSQTFIQDEVVSEVANLLHALVEQVHDDHEATEFYMSSTSCNNLSQNLTNDSDQESISTSFNESNNYDSFTDFNSSNNDSALGESSAFSDTVSSRNDDFVEEDDDETNDSAYHMDDTIMSLSDQSNIFADDICSEQEYVRSLRRRRGLCSSPKHETAEKAVGDDGLAANNMLKWDFDRKDLGSEYLPSNDTGGNDKSKSNLPDVKPSTPDPSLSPVGAAHDEALQASTIFAVEMPQSLLSQDISVESLLSETIVEEYGDNAAIKPIEEIEIMKEPELENHPKKFESLLPDLTSHVSDLKLFSSDTLSCKVSQPIEDCKMEVGQNSPFLNKVGSLQSAAKNQDSIFVTQLIDEIMISNECNGEAGASEVQMKPVEMPQSLPSQDISVASLLSETIVVEYGDNAAIKSIEDIEIMKESDLENHPKKFESLLPDLKSPISDLMLLPSGPLNCKVSQPIKDCKVEVGQNSPLLSKVESLESATNNQDNIFVTQLIDEIMISNGCNGEAGAFIDSEVHMKSENLSQEIKSFTSDLTFSASFSNSSCKVLPNMEKYGVKPEKKKIPPIEDNTSEPNAKIPKIESIANIPCPVCSRNIPETSINKHLDICTGAESKVRSLRNRRAELTKQKQVDHSKNKEVEIKKDTTPQSHAEKITPKSESGAATEGKFLRLRNNRKVLRPNNEKCSQEPQGISLLPTGVDKLKAALKDAIASSNAVKDMVMQTAAAESRSEKAKDSKSPICNAFIQAFGQMSPTKKIESPLLKSPLKVKIRSKERKFENSDSSEIEENSSNEEEEEISEEESIPLAPTRRSSRATRSRKSYREAGTSEDEDKEQAEMQKRPRKKKRKEQAQDAIKTDSVQKLDGDSSKENKQNMLDTSNISEYETGDEEECEEHGLNEEEVKELLVKKYHTPDNAVVSHVEKDSSGARYFYGMPVDPSQPKFLTGGVLREYQITGYQWLKLLYENGESGILADEMGLGKTIQCIALMCKLFKSGVRGPFLVCGPTSTINNWVSEFKRFAPKISFMLYHGTASERCFMRQFLFEKVQMEKQVVMITSYEILLRDRSHLNNYCWAHMILDEGHRVKNLKSKTFAELKSFPASCKLMLTGTPLQNNVAELWSLLNFIFPEVFDDVQVFEAWFAIESLQKNEKLLSMLHQILTPFVLRRVKSDVEVKIPPKREILVSAPLGSLQDKYYRATVDKSILQLVKNKEYYNVTPGVADPNLLSWMAQDDDPGEGRWTRSKRKVSVDIEKKRDNNENDIDYVINITLNNMMMHLRKCCNHPYLIKHPLKPGSDELLVNDAIVSSCGKMMLLDRMLPALKENGHKVIMFTQMTTMLDILEDYCNYRSYCFVRFDGSTRCEDRHEYIKEFNENSDIFIFLLSTRAGGLGINLTAADTVIIYDSDWNPHNDLQAQDRCHRIGQEKPVVVYRLVSMGTIDQQIVERASRKRKLEKMVMHQEKFKGNLATELVNPEVITTKELLTILEATTNISVVENKESVISDADFHRLLDRSDMLSNTSLPSTETSPLSRSQTHSTAAAFHIIDETREETICG